MTVELQVENLTKKVDTMSHKVDKMYDLLVGNELDSSTAYVTKIQNLEKAVKDLSDFKQKMIYVAIGMSIPTGAGLIQIIGFLFGIK